MSRLSLPQGGVLSRQALTSKLPFDWFVRLEDPFGDEKIVARDVITKANEKQLSEMLILLGCKPKEVWAEDIKPKRKLLLAWWDKQEAEQREREATFPALKAEWLELKRARDEADKRMREIQRLVPMQVLDPEGWAPHHSHAILF